MASLVRFASSIALSGVGRRTGLEAPVGDEPGDAGEQEEQHGGDQEAEPAVGLVEDVVDAPRERLEREDQAEEHEEAGGRADRGAAREALGTFSSISALASSISSRTRIEAFSEMRLTTSPRERSTSCTPPFV